MGHKSHLKARVIQSRMIREARRVARMRTFCLENVKGKGHLGDVGIDMGIILNSLRK
jgi:hypothetical protein